MSSRTSLSEVMGVQVTTGVVMTSPTGVLDGLAIAAVTRPTMSRSQMMPTARPSSPMTMRQPMRLSRMAFAAVDTVSLGAMVTTPPRRSRF